MSAPTFRAAPTRVRVPATSANLGPGFDALGLALNWYDDIVARVGGSTGLTVDVAGEGADDVPRDERHLVVVAMRAAFDVLGRQPSGIELVCANRIPHGRGLGSSAAAIVCGLLAARAVTLGGEARLPDDAVLRLATQLEGHPDNVAACLRGGLTIAWLDADEVGCLNVPVDPTIAPVVYVPGMSSSTEATRAMLPSTVPFPDAAGNAARSALLVEALRSSPDALMAATEDRLHQPYRAAAMPESAALMDSLRYKGFPAVISGAGPTVLALTTDDQRAAATALGPSGWGVHALEVDPHGARVVPV